LLEDVQNKTQAAILTFKDAKNFLRDSGYAAKPKLSDRPARSSRVVLPEIRRTLKAVWIAFVQFGNVTADAAGNGGFAIVPGRVWSLYRSSASQFGR
jgi:hypothetical protein